jgi:hypothetical protein
MDKKTHKYLIDKYLWACGPCRARTSDPLIMSQLL